MSKCHKKNSNIFLQNNDCKTSYIDIYIDLLSINFNLLSVLQRYAYHQISDIEIYTFTNNNIIAKYIVFFNIISAVSDNILRICIQELLLIPKKLQFFFILYQHLTPFSSAINFTCLIPGNVCVDMLVWYGMLEPIKTLVLIRHHVQRIL